LFEHETPVLFDCFNDCSKFAHRFSSAFLSSRAKSRDL
jgi:hypothetical protein